MMVVVQIILYSLRIILLKHGEFTKEKVYSDLLRFIYSNYHLEHL